MRSRLLAAVSVLLSIFSTASQALQAEVVAEGLAVPWGLAFINNEQLLVTERNGGIKRINLKTNKQTPLNTPSHIAAAGQGGLLDIAFSPNDPTRVYLTYSKKGDGGAVTALAMSQYIDGRLSAWEDILITSSLSTTSRHFGSRIAFDNDNNLYMTIGDRGERDNGQNTHNHAGALLRLHQDGSPVSDNPFYHSDEGADEVYSYGHRNAQGLYYDSATDSLWSIEHGPRGGDEINLIERGANYGWAKTSHGKEYWGPLSVGEAESLPGVIDPKLVYIPSIAPSGLILYRGTRYPSLNGKLLAGALKLTHINVVSLDNKTKDNGDINNSELVETERLFTSLGERIRDIQLSPDGFLYFSTDSGRIYRIIP